MHKGPNGDARMFKIPDDPRVTRAGRVLRRYSLDELPQLINVVRGEMSIVGPRPLIPDEHQYVTDWAERRLALRPGMTGLWQVLGRSGIPFEEMVRLDYVYVNTWSLWNDLRLMARTVPALFGANGRF
jgi:lipopolysaccharide/colanic/teichoic acid biosynthesis glycosyltransferase